MKHLEPADVLGAAGLVACVWGAALTFRPGPVLMLAGALIFGVYLYREAQIAALLKKRRQAQQEEES